MIKDATINWSFFAKDFALQMRPESEWYRESMFDTLYTFFDTFLRCTLNLFLKFE